MSTDKKQPTTPANKTSKPSQVSGPSLPAPIPPKPPESVLAMPDPRTCLAVLVETDDKKRPNGWASKEAFEATMSAIKSETVNFVEQYKAWQKRSTDMALIVFYARKQYAALHPVATDMDFIGDFFDPKCKTLKQAQAMRENTAYRAIVTYLFRIAREFVQAETSRKIDLAAKQKQLAASKQLLAEVQTGTISDKTKKDVLTKVPLTDAVRAAILAPSPKVDAAMEATLTETTQQITNEVAKLSNPLSFDGKPQKEVSAVVNKAGAKNEPIGKAIAVAKVALQKAGVDAVTFNTVIDELIKSVFVALDREPKAALAKANEYFLSLSSGQVHVDEVIPPTATIPATETHAPVAETPTEQPKAEEPAA